MGHPTVVRASEAAPWSAVDTRRLVIGAIQLLELTEHVWLPVISLLAGLAPLMLDQRVLTRFGRPSCASEQSG
jgi:hypothetical protein